MELELCQIISIASRYTLKNRIFDLQREVKDADIGYFENEKRIVSNYDSFFL